MSLGDVNLAAAAVVVDTLVEAGVSHACVSPGSRSTPIALALARDSRITLHVHLDERSSAFFALGIARATGDPVAVACTSGTAAAELLPAVVEAFMSRVPLLLLTADRPPRLRGTGANQTIDQVELFGRYAIYAELSLPTEPVPAASIRGRIADALEAAGSRGIPVHLNLPFDEPLVPSGSPVAVDEALSANKMAAGSESSGRAQPPEDLAQLVSGRRGVVVLGRTLDEPWLDGVLDLAGALRWPVIAEPISGARRPGRALLAGQALLGGARWLDAHRPEVVMQIGSTPTTRATQALVASAERLIVIDADLPEPDPDRRATLRIHAHPTLFGLPAEPAPDGWFRTWEEADRTARAVVDAVLDRTKYATELRLARDVAAWVPAGGTLFVGNSMPIRDLDFAMAPREGLRVLANRGASGIDGLVSTALGVASAGGGPTAALIGDLSLVHDAGALLWNGRRGPDITLVVPNNGGGAIFSFLGQKALAEFEELFATPHGLDLDALCRAALVSRELVELMDDLSRALDRAVGSAGVRVVEVAIDPDRNSAQHEEVRAAVDDALS